MEGEGKKRKVDKDEAQDKEKEEEEKMEMFFALIRSTRDARDRLIGDLDDSKEKDGKKVDEEKPISWTPPFKWEDFMEETKSGTTPVDIAGPSKTEGEAKQEKEDDGEDGGLDLKLSL